MIAARKNAYFQARPVSRLHAVISARIGDEQSLGIYSIPDGLAFLLMLGHKAPPWAGTLQIGGRDARAQYASLRSPAR